VPVLIGTIGGGTTITEMAINLSEIVLPVLLTDFSVTKSGHTSVLSWITHTEINNDYFILERSLDGRTFTPVSGRIISKAVNGNSNIPLQYAYIDLSPVKGINYYRLLQVDKDSRTKYSEVVKATFTDLPEVSIYPNPVHNELNIYGYLPQMANLKFELVDAKAATVLSMEKAGANANWNVQLKLSRLPAGIYYIRIFNNKIIMYSGMVYKD